MVSLIDKVCQLIRRCASGLSNKLTCSVSIAWPGIWAVCCVEAAAGERRVSAGMWCSSQVQTALSSHDGEIVTGKSLHDQRYRGVCQVRRASLEAERRIINRQKEKECMINTGWRVLGGLVSLDVWGVQSFGNSHRSVIICLLKFSYSSLHI